MKTLVLVVHPNLAESQVNRRWAEAIGAQEGVTVHKLYEAYPDWQIDVAKEQALLEAHDRIVLQFPFYWYSSPALLKKYLDDVLTYGWAFGSTGTKLRGKELLIAISAGGARDDYEPGGRNQYSVGELLRPFQATSNMIGTTYLPIFFFGGLHQRSEEEIEQSAQLYVKHALNPDYAAQRLVQV
ncbi:MULTISPECIES: NAD(P)H-dependent oxidoreductase [Paenibacillus]|uniref:NAD(P)H-dependent oxidoreductase n=1 Tax=Paenibacillus TaxID=44249 RepID=UPI0022B8AF40|nr:NAD(P)H-dependent oxidoreductase [Paenibacillus caseinilyticus]MCZ8522154.1 NAD(P)H-dependent oxidoreductase [Paenibacillus caseinilyticus]